MIEELKPYEKYQVPVAGLPSLPAHWNARRTKSVLREIDRRTKTGTERLLSLRMNVGLVDHHAAGGKRVPPSALIGYKRVLPGELVMNRMRAAIGLFGAAGSEGLVSPDYAIFGVSSELNVKYAVSLFKTPVMTALFRLESRGLGTGESGFLRLYSDRFGVIRMPLPPPEEQAAIVRFLDYANQSVDRYVRAKRRQIALLHEQKLVIVQRRVLRGLRARPALKPSGINWVGDISADWDVIPTRYLFRPVTRRDITGAEPKMSMSRHLGLVRSDVLHANRAAQAATAVAFSVCHPGDLVMNKYQAHAGLFGAATERGLITANYSVFAPTERAFTPYFALLYTSSAYRTIFRIASRGVGDGMMPLYTSAFHRVPSVVPPLSEQHEIVANVERETAGIDAAIAIIERQIQQISEYRTRLVADVVTGQLDVRAAAADLLGVGPETVPIESEGDETDIDDGDVA